MAQGEGQMKWLALLWTAFLLCWFVMGDVTAFFLTLLVGAFFAWMFWWNEHQERRAAEEDWRQHVAEEEWRRQNDDLQ